MLSKNLNRVTWAMQIVVAVLELALSAAVAGVRCEELLTPRRVTADSTLGR